METIREAGREAVDRTSLRQVARDVGIHAMVLSAFLQGAEPRDPTLAKLREWYFSEAASRGAITVASARAAVDLLTSPVPAEDRRTVILGILTILHAIWQRRGTAVPGWLTELLGELYPLEGQIPVSGGDPNPS